MRKGDYTKHCKSYFHLTGKRKPRKDNKQNDYICKHCGYKSTNKLNYNQHLLNNHTSNDQRKTSFKYFCDKCNFGINVESLYKKHCNTKKHKIKT